MKFHVKVSGTTYPTAVAPHEATLYMTFVPSHAFRSLPFLFSAENVFFRAGRRMVRKFSIRTFIHNDLSNHSHEQGNKRGDLFEVDQETVPVKHEMVMDQIYEAPHIHMKRHNTTGYYR